MNGFGVYTTWLVIASLINFTIALAYAGETDLKVNQHSLVGSFDIKQVNFMVKVYFTLKGSVRIEPIKFLCILHFTLHCTLHFTLHCTLHFTKTLLGNHFTQILVKRQAHLTKKKKDFI